MKNSCWEAKKCYCDQLKGKKQNELSPLEKKPL